MTNLFNNFKSLFISNNKEVNIDSSRVFFGNDADIVWETNRLSQKPDENLAKVLKEDILEYHKHYGILEDEILEYHKIFHLKGWKRDQGTCTEYLIEVNPVFRIYFFCDSQRICRRIKFLYKRE